MRSSLLLNILAMFTGYTATAHFAASFVLMESGIAVLWLPNAIVLVTLLLHSRKHWWKISIAAIAAELVVGGIGSNFQLIQSFCFGLVNIFEALLAATLLQRFLKEDLTFANLREVTIFLVIALGVAPAIAALGGAWAFKLSPVSDVSFWMNWRIWWLGDGMGMIAAAPLLLTWLQNPHTQFLKSGRGISSALALASLSTVLCFFLFYPETGTQSLLGFSPLLLLPLILWAAKLHGVKGVTLLGAFICLSAVIGSAQGRGLFASLPTDVRTVVLQQFLASVLVTGLAIAAVLNDLQTKYESSRLFTEAAQHLYEGLTITDARLPDRPIVYANPRFEELTGYKSEEFLGKNCRFLNALHRDQPELKMLHEAVSRNESMQCTVQNFKKDGTPFWNLLTISPIKDEKGVVTHFIGIQRDVTKMIETEEQLRRANAQLSESNQILEERVIQRTADLERLATTDPLTGAFNRRYWMRRAEIDIASATRQSTALSVVMMDLDHFKLINDRFGHQTGDLVLINLCSEIEQVLRLGDTFARFGGEEFALLLPGADENFALQIAERIRELIASMEMTAFNGTRFSFTASLGVASLSEDNPTVGSLLAKCDTALYRAKDDGRDCVRSANQTQGVIHT